MSGFDLIVVAIILVSVIVGVWRGFVKEALSLASWILAFWLGNTFSQEAGDFLAQYVNLPTETFRTWAGFTLVFIGTLIAFALISFAITKLILHGPIKTLDRFLGLAFGGARGALIVVAVILVARGFGLDQSAWWQNSSLIPKFIPTADVIEKMLPESFQRDETRDESGNTDLIKTVIKDQLPEELVAPAKPENND